jgi:DNA-binding transcriptional MerR regulator
MDDGLSVTELAERIARRHFPGDDIDSLSRQIRHWTEQGALRPIGGSEGRGHHRRYPQQAVYVAAILSELARFGVPVAGLKAASDLLYKAGVWRFARDTDEMHLRFAYELVGEKRARGFLSTVTASDVVTQTFKKPQLPLTVFSVNVTALFSRLRQ